MNKIVIKLITVIAITTLSGCVSHKNIYSNIYEKPKFYKPSPQEESTADYGKYPDDYETIIKNYMQSILKDPESARYRFDKPTKFYTTAKTRQEIKYCWDVDFHVNSKNSYGGYTGEKSGYAQIRNGQVINYYLYE